jgi:hypothetical protein
MGLALGKRDDYTTGKNNSRNMSMHLPPVEGTRS